MDTISDFDLMIQEDVEHEWELLLAYREQDQQAHVEAYWNQAF